MFIKNILLIKMYLFLVLLFTTKWLIKSSIETYPVRRRSIIEIIIINLMMYFYLILCIYININFFKHIVFIMYYNTKSIKHNLLTLCVDMIGSIFLYYYIDNSKKYVVLDIVSSYFFGNIHNISIGIIYINIVVFMLQTVIIPCLYNYVRKSTTITNYIVVCIFQVVGILILLPPY